MSPAVSPEPRSPSPPPSGVVAAPKASWPPDASWPPKVSTDPACWASWPPRGVVSAPTAATDLVERGVVALGAFCAVTIATTVAVATAMGAFATATDLVERGVVVLGAVGAVVVAGARPRLPGAPGRASRRAALAICPTRGRRSIGEGARAAAAAARRRVAAPGPRAQVDDRGRFTLGVETAQRRHRGVRAGSGEIREAHDPVRDFPAGRRRIAVACRGVAVAVGHLRSRPARAAARCRRRAPRRCRASP